MKIKRMIPIALGFFLLASGVQPAVFAMPEDPLNTNVFKVTTSEDFAAGNMENIEPVEVGNGAIRLKDGQTEGTFTSKEYTINNFTNMVASWNASLPEGTSVEVMARTQAAGGGQWSDWFSWGKYGPTIFRGSASENIDEYIIGTTVDKAQFKAILRRANAADEAPVLRQMTFSTKGADTVIGYEETPVATLPTSKMTKAPGYSQMIRDPDIGGSICSPSTMTVLMNSRVPSLDLLPEELALSIRDFSYGYGNWAFSASSAGLYGFESYVQYGDINVILQELANGRSVGVSVAYSTDSGDEDYLPGAYGSTGGHLISLVGYEFPNGDTSDMYDLYLISSDTYSLDDATTFHRYQWKYFKNCWTNGVIYMVSSKQEDGAAVTGVKRYDGTLTATSEDNVYTFAAGGSDIDLTNFTAGKTTTLGRGVLAYTIEGMKTSACKETEYSIDYGENRMQATANDTFFYSGISGTEDGKLGFDAGAALFAAGVPEGETKDITVYAMANNGKLYKAKLTATSKKAVTEDFDGEYETVKTNTNLVHVDLTKGTVKDGAVQTDGTVTLADGAAAGRYLSPVYENEWPWEYLMAAINASTPGASSVEVQVRTMPELADGEWCGWYSFGRFGSGIESMSTSQKDDYMNMNVDELMVRGDSSEANVKKSQIRVILRADEEGNVPAIHGLNFTYKKEAYSNTEGVYTGKTKADEIPKSVSVDIFPTSAYSYADGMHAWRFENMMLMMLNSRGGDLLFEEVALNGLDFNAGWGNWTYTILKAGLFGSRGYTQFGATTTMIKQALADGNIVGLYVNGSMIPSTNSAATSQTVVYAYETSDDGTVKFKLVCPRGDTSELAGGDVMGECTEAELQTAIEGAGSSSIRGAMYVVGPEEWEPCVERIPVEAQNVSESSVKLVCDGETVVLPADFVDNKDTSTGNGVVAYTLKSETDKLPEGTKLALRKFYYDLTIANDGTLSLPEELQTKIKAGDTAELFVIFNNGKTYTAEIVSDDELAKRKEAALKEIDALEKQYAPVNDVEAKKVADAAREEINGAMSVLAVENALEKAKADFANVKPYVYEILAGPGQTHYLGTQDTIVIKCSGPLDKLTAIEVAGKTLDPKYYATTEGSTVLTLKADYLNSLKVGTYDLKFVYSNGYADTNFKIAEKAKPAEPEKPATGDASSTSLWITAMILAAAAAAAFALKRRGERR